jgi:ParB family chromosome partitioning protein
MGAKKRGLGRGLDALLSADTNADVLSKEDISELKMLDIDLVKRGRYQPRIKIEENSLSELAQSIKEHGVLQPVVVRKSDDGSGYELIAGERRWRASQLAGLRELPAIIKEIDESDAMSVALIENIQREQLNPIEEALALARLVNEFSMTHAKVATSIGKSRATVSNLIRLLDLEERSRQLLEDGSLEMGHARALLGISGPFQEEIAARAAEENLSVRVVEGLIKKSRVKSKENPTEGSRRDPNIAGLESSISERIGAQVEIRHRNSGAGKVVISYNSLDELDGILEHIKL